MESLSWLRTVRGGHPDRKIDTTESIRTSLGCFICNNNDNNKMFTLLFPRLSNRFQCADQEGETLVVRKVI